MVNNIKLPVGIENFEDMRKRGFYYIDKTGLIEQLVENGGKVTLFTRPRRFGKTLSMSMLRSFFSIGAEAVLFDGLYISKNEEICKQHMGKYPVIFLSLKGVEGLTFERAKYRIIELIGIEAERFDFLAESGRLSDIEKEKYKALITLRDGRYTMDEDILVSSLWLLSYLLYKHYGQKTVILIDEYDVPLDKAFQNGYYNEMVSLIKGIFGQALKTNDYLQFAVLTGCLRISKESIFTGLNNFKVMSIDDSRFYEQFGFTDKEVSKLLLDYGLSQHYDEIREWYDGYHFGNADVYCPWDVINHVDNLHADGNARPQAYWINSSSNSLVRKLVNVADATTKDEIERLIAGDAIVKTVRLELTYDEIEDSIDNIWSVLYTTGYLTKAGEVKLQDSEAYAYRLVIPNKEVREVFIFQIREWFKKALAGDTKTMNLLSQAFLDADAASVHKGVR